MERIQYRIAKKIIVLSSGMQKNIEEKGVDPKKIEVIANWADVDHVKPLPKDNDFSRTHDLTGRFVVLFAGNHGYIASLENLIEAADLLQEDPEILIMLAGEGSVKQQLIDLADKKDLKNVRFLTTQPEEQWLEMLAAADLGFVSLNSDLANLNVPSKVYTLMAAAKPILASVPEESEVARAVKLAKSGLICKPDDPADLAQAILRARDMPVTLAEYGLNGRKFMEKNYNRKLQTASYLAVMESARAGD